MIVDKVLYTGQGIMMENINDLKSKDPDNPTEESDFLCPVCNGKGAVGSRMPDAIGLCICWGCNGQPHFKTEKIKDI